MKKTAKTQKQNNISINLAMKIKRHIVFILQHKLI